MGEWWEETSRHWKKSKKPVRGARRPGRGGGRQVKPKKNLRQPHGELAIGCLAQSRRPPKEGDHSTLQELWHLGCQAPAHG